MLSTSFIGDQIVGATVYFDNMSPEETAELLKTLNRHKVGLKLQNRDKSPGCSPLSTPCRSPMGTLTWEGKTRFGGSSPDIILVSCLINYAVKNHVYAEPMLDFYPIAILFSNIFVYLHLGVL